MDRKMDMKVLLLKDVEKVGLEGQMLSVADGYATNYLLPLKLAVQISAENEKFYATRVKHAAVKKEVVESKTSMLAEKIKLLRLTLKRKMHDDEKLYGSIAEGEVVDLLAQQGISVTKNQVIFDKSIKTKGTFDVTIKLSSKLQPVFVLKVVPE